MTLRSRMRVRQAGVGLIEVLIALLILSIGFLGIAALEAMSLSTNNSAYARSMATIGTYSILDAMRADLTSAKAGNYNTSVAANTCSSIGTGTLALQQLTTWCNSLGGTLGAAASTTGAVNCDGNGNCTITITFDDSRFGNGYGCSAKSGAQQCSAQTFTTQAVL